MIQALLRVRVARQFHPVQGALPSPRTLLLLLITAVWFPILGLAADEAPKRTAAEVLVVFNEQSPVSKSVAEYYAAKRKVTNLLAVQCVDSAVSTEHETIPLEVYRAAVEKPVVKYLAEHPEVQCIVLTKGVPIRISGAETGQRSVNSPASTPLTTSLDSHLAALGYAGNPEAKQISITGSGATGVGWLNRYWNSHEPFSHEKFGGYLVTRLDGYTEADAKALVDRALAAEQEAPTGEVLLDVQPNFGLGDKAGAPFPIREAVIKDESAWSEYNADMRRAHDLLDERGIPNELDLSPVFVGKRTGLAGYCSWGSNDAKFSARAYASLTFSPGSICDTAVSTSARTFLHIEGGQSLLTDLIAHGLTCGKGYTDEPLLQAIASPTILFDHYTAGWSMAESFYAASHFVGWQDVVIGDPLCVRPGGKAP